MADLNPKALARAGRKAPQARLTSNLEDVLADPEVEAVVLATPVKDHHTHVMQALRAGKHVFVEKPLSSNSTQGREMADEASARNRLLMVGHTFIYNSVVREVKRLITSGELGDIYYAVFQRLNLGRVRQDVNVLWNLAPHDFSIMDYWFGGEPDSITARGATFLQPGIEDVAFVHLTFPGGLACHFHLSWLDPNKVRRVTVVGSKKMIVYDDTSAEARLQVYDCGIDKRQLDYQMGSYENFGQWQLIRRAGDLWIPRVDFHEPLEVEASHFVDCVRNGVPCLSDARAGLRIVELLERAQASMRGAAA
ncbi:MAG: scyllo-inositol 2-dehydrogenase (NAD(+)) [Myxococcota bacterium]|nr:scyllo-inositol 2-dehydrogenase (NAD(+)) [Myxococcota bacterium]